MQAVLTQFDDTPSVWDHLIALLEKMIPKELPVATAISTKKPLLRKDKAATPLNKPTPKPTPAPLKRGASSRSKLPPDPSKRALPKPGADGKPPSRRGSRTIPPPPPTRGGKAGVRGGRGAARGAGAGAGVKRSLPKPGVRR